MNVLFHFKCMLQKRVFSDLYRCHTKKINSQYRIKRKIGGPHPLILLLLQQ